MKNCFLFNAPFLRKRPIAELGCPQFNELPSGGRHLTPENELLANDGALLLSNDGIQLTPNS